MNATTGEGNPAMDHEDQAHGGLVAPWDETSDVTTIAEARRILEGTKAMVPMYIGAGTKLVQTVHETVYDMIRQGFTAHMSYTKDLNHCVVSFSERDDMAEHVAERYRRYGYV